MQCIHRKRIDRREVIVGAGSLAAALAIGTGRSGAQDWIANDEAARAAVFYSGLEVDEQIWPLYRWMHPDSKELVPYYAVEFWYENTILPRGPEEIVPTDVRYIDWTWDVTGVTYRNTAEVSFTQEFADGEMVDDVVRLVRDGEDWKWFFGRDQAFLDEQVTLGGEGLFPDDPADPADWMAPLVELGGEAVERLPDEHPGAEDATLEPVGARGQGTERFYRRRDGAVVARVLTRPVTIVEDQATAAGEVDTRLAVDARTPMFRVRAWDVRDDADPVFAVCERATGPVNADTVEVTVASDSTGQLWTISGPDEDEIGAIAGLLVG